MYNFKKKWLFCLIGFFLLTLWIYWGNSSIEISEIVIENKSIPKAFDDFKIVQISDLHNAEFGDNQKILLKKISEEKPDIIVITGDLIDSNHTDIKIAMLLVEGIVELAPVYFVTGNHEAWSQEYESLKNQLIQTGVNILDDEAIIIKYKNSTLQLIGLSDPDFTQSGDFYETNAIINTKLQDMIDKNSHYKILLSHRPELINIYSQNHIDLVLSGHAHGGQFRLPFIGGLLSPNQGIFPKYTEGKHTIAQTELIISRGLGNSIIPFRINNRPELVTIKLKYQTETK